MVNWDLVGFAKDHALSWMNDLATEDRVIIQLRMLQNKTNCATSTLQEAVDILQPHLRCKSFGSFAKMDAKMSASSGAESLALHGCVGCHMHVFHPNDPDGRCPLCNHPRFSGGKPNEVCWYFPLRVRLEKLLQLPQFRKFLQHEFVRPKNPDYMSDVYDAPYWLKMAGNNRPPTILLQYCIDGIPAFTYGGLSIKPAEFMILNLPPILRTNTRNILLHMLIPNQLKGQEAKKYYDWAAAFEMNSLHRIGVRGHRVVVYGTTLDAPGRAENLQMQSHSAYYGCPHCEHMFSPGLETKPVFGGFRRWLPIGHPWRHRRVFRVYGCEYMFPDEETRPPAKTRTNQSAFECIHLATRTRPFRGHKSSPYLCRWLSFSWEMITADMMHDVKCVCVMLLKVLVGQGAHGMYATWNSKDSDNKHREYCRVHNIFPDVHDVDNPLPWRLTRAQLDVVDDRVKSMWWPHYMDVLHKDGYSFWKKSCTMWKSRHKLTILMVFLFFFFSWVLNF